MLPAIHFQVQERDGIPVAQLQGEIDLANASDLRDALFATLANYPPGLIVDLSGVTYLDSRGVHVLLELAERMKSRHQRLVLVMPEQGVTRRILQLTRLDAMTPLDASVEEALARMRSEP